jgi:hypothetical protein
MSPPLTADAVAAACLEHAMDAVPDAWGFGWLAETLAVLLLTELEARPRLVAAVDAAVAGDLLRVAARLLRDPGHRARTRRLLFSAELTDWWARWETLDPALREMGFAMPVEWLLALWPPPATRPAAPPSMAAVGTMEAR